MSKREYSEMREEIAVAPKKKRKHNLFSLILCLMVAFVIWLYASSLEKKDEEEQLSNNALFSDHSKIVSQSFEL